MFLVKSPNRMNGYGRLRSQAMDFYYCNHIFQRRRHCQYRSNRLHDGNMVVDGLFSAC